LTPCILASRITKRPILVEIAAGTGMPTEANTPSAIEQAVSRALRDNLERIQRTSDELHQAIADLVAACGSTKPVNSLGPMLRAQTSAASLSAGLEVLSRFVAVSLQAGPRTPFEAEIARIAGSLPAAEAVVAPPAVVGPASMQPQAAVPVAHVAPAVKEHHAPARDTHAAVPAVEEHHVPAPFPHLPVVEESHEVEPPPAVVGESEDAGSFNVSRLSAEEQELHRRANRVAKVSMQDIKMLRPEQVRLGREHKDICVRLRDDIEKAHREYDRRFKPIMDHPVDYFYRWMVEILAEGDAHALGEYPYATTAARH
jgi:hypothetical protein